MVVTRRVPAPPAPPTSRTTSTQNTSRASRTKAQTSQQQGDAKTPSARPRTPPPTPHSDRKGKRLKCRSLFPSFSFIFTLFSLYALSTLYPSPAQSLHKALSIPHDNLIKPFILPPLRTALSHPVIESHVTNVRATLQPYAQRVDSTARPIVSKLSHLEKNHLRPLVRRGTIASSHLIRKTWQRFVVPAYQVYLHPHVQPSLDRWNSFYSHKVKSRFRTFRTTVSRGYSRVKPRAVRLQRSFLSKSAAVYSEVAPRVQHFYGVAKPRVAAFWVKAQPHLQTTYRYLKIQALRSWLVAKTYGSIAATQIGEARREFVDPHIKRIWEKVEHHSTLSSTASSTLSSPAPATSTILVDATITSPSLRTTVDSEAASVPLFMSTESHSNPTNIPVGSQILEPAASVIAESIGIGAAAELENEISASGDAPIATVPPQSETTIHWSAQATVKATLNYDPVLLPQAPIEAGNIDDFLQELGISSSEEPNDSLPIFDEASVQHAFSAKDEEDASASAAASRAKVAAKRAAIVKRHTEWQSQMDDLFKAREQDLRRTLVSMRKKAVEALNSHDGQGKVVDSVEQEAGRLAKGVEAYLKKEQDRKENTGREWYEQLDEKKNQWEKVLNKVDEKFADKVKSVQEEVHGWYINTREKEGEEVLKAASELKSFAERAQADLGMDYAWLEDVSYEDWQKYHDLMRTAERFEGTARTVQNGTHAHPPVDPLSPALEALERNVQSIIDGFAARLSMLRSEGKDLYAYREPETRETLSPSASSSGEPTMSILPIGSGAAQDHLVDASNVILSKSEEQIKQALGVAGFAVEGNDDAQNDKHEEL